MMRFIRHLEEVLAYGRVIRQGVEIEYCHPHPNPSDNTHPHITEKTRIQPILRSHPQTVTYRIEMECDRHKR